VVACWVLKMFENFNADAVAAAKSNSEAAHAKIPGNTVTHTLTETVQTVHTEVKETATNKIISQEISIDKTKEDDDGIISQSPVL